MNKTHTTNNPPVLMSEFFRIMLSPTNYKMIQT